MAFPNVHRDFIRPPITIDRESSRAFDEIDSKQLCPPEFKQVPRYVRLGSEADSILDPYSEWY